VAEMAFAVVLVVGAALFIGSFVSLIQIDPGFNPEHVLTAQISPRIESRTEPPDSGPAFTEIVERISRIPGVIHASMISGGIPLSGGVSITTVPVRDGVISLSMRRVTPDYHSALK